MSKRSDYRFVIPRRTLQSVISGNPPGRQLCRGISGSFGLENAELRAFIAGAGFLVAYNASFFRDVLYRCCKAAGIAPPVQEFRCALQLARARWNLASGGLRAVCDCLGISLDHHHALSDAEACAKIAVRALA